MIARFAGLFAMCMFTTGAAMVPLVEVTPVRELQAVSRPARDEDLQGDWNKCAWLGGAYLMRADSQKAMPALQRALEIRKDFWWVSCVAMPQARRPALTTFDDGPARTRSVIVRVRMSFVVSEWLQAVWAAMRSVFEYGNAWSRALLFSRG
jgi:hypothetical protein